MLASSGGSAVCKDGIFFFLSDQIIHRHGNKLKVHWENQNSKERKMNRGEMMNKKKEPRAAA